MHPPREMSAEQAEWLRQRRRELGIGDTCVPILSGRCGGSMGSRRTDDLDPSAPGFAAEAARQSQLQAEWEASSVGQEELAFWDELAVEAWRQSELIGHSPESPEAQAWIAANRILAAAALAGVAGRARHRQRVPARVLLTTRRLYVARSGCSGAAGRLARWRS
jgi:hypothetical protein